MQPIVWWIVVSVVFFSMELVTLSFFYIWIGLGALATAVVSHYFAPLWIQCVVFSVFSILFVLLSRLWRPSFLGGTRRPANMDALVGAEGLVLKIDKTQKFQGYIKVEGQYWKVVTRDQKPLELDAKVKVIEAKGNVLVVEI